MSWIGKIIDLAPVLAAGGASAVSAWRDRKRAPSERLATAPRPIDAGLKAMLQERERQSSE